ncbi:MAG: O-antigen ligase domain-containing protein [Flavobacterium sp.]|nr:MAG: O-antigen ligase domain-containing protein [Flavobacterium sp.]
MIKSNKQYLFFILLHIALGGLIFYVPSLAKVYGYGSLFVGAYIVLKNRNQNHEALYVAGYIVGSEVFLRMTQGNPVYEFSKYGVMLFIFIGMYYKGFSKFAIPYWIFLALLIPGLVIAAYSLNYDTEMRKTISFNISGPLCLGVASLYTYYRRITLQQFNTILLCVGMPVITCACYLMLYTPNIRDVITGTGSNFETSGGFGPNQVSTILGLGMFIFLSRVMFNSKTKFIMLVNLTVALVIGYRGLVTFSRGGMITSVVILVVLVLMTYGRINSRGRMKLNFAFLFFALTLFAVWTYSSAQTGGLIEKRYANQDAAGRVKSSHFTGREMIFETEIQFFLDHPVFGIGVAKGAELRRDATGLVILSHNEVSRMLAEHGSLGIMALLILFFTPLILYIDNRDHVFMLSCLIFWLLTINHAAMRIGAPAFIYALSILRISTNEEPAVHRE